jgi:hypothetical protein
MISRHTISYVTTCYSRRTRLARKTTLTIYTRELNTILCGKVNERSRLLYRRVGDEPITKMITNQYIRRIPNGKRHKYFPPEVHVLAGTLRPCCVDQHLVVRAAKRCRMNLIQPVDTARTYSQVR